MVHVQASKALHHLAGMAAETLVLKKMLQLSRYTMTKKDCTVIQVQNQFNFSSGNNRKKFHQLSFYLIKILQALTELLIWIVFCSCDILMPKLVPFLPTKAGGV